MANNIVPTDGLDLDLGTEEKPWRKVIARSADIGTMTGNVTGNLTGNVTGNLTGNVTGNLTGNVTGNLTGNVTGDLTGNVTGNLTGNVTGDLTGNADTATNAINDGNGNNIVDTYLPAVTGAVVAFAGNALPDGWLLCDGSAVSRADYAALFSVIGTSYGAGDGSATFNLPNLTDRFIQGNNTVGKVKSAGLPNITGWLKVGRAFEMFGEGAFSTTVAGSVYTAGDIVVESASRAELDASRSSSIYGNSTTVQPPALTMRYIIKY